MTEGWKCPVCGKGVSPHEKFCDHGGAAPAPMLPVWPGTPMPSYPDRGWEFVPYWQRQPWCGIAQGARA